MFSKLSKTITSRTENVSSHDFLLGAGCAITGVIVLVVALKVAKKSSRKKKLAPLIFTLDEDSSKVIATYHIRNGETKFSEALTIIRNKLNLKPGVIYEDLHTILTFILIICYFVLLTLLLSIQIIILYYPTDNSHFSN